MPTIEATLHEIGYLDRLASRDTAVHRVDPRAKVVVTLVFIVCVVSYGKYEILPMLAFALYPVFLAAAGDLPFGFIAKRLLIAAPFALAVGMFNPLLDREVVGLVAGVPITGGWVSFASIMLRFALTTSAALALVGTTGMNGVCAAIDRLGAPDVFATQLLFMYRYIFVLAEEVMNMSRARSMRSFGGRGTGLGAYVQIVGHLLLRSYARARRIYQAMLCRAFDGRVRVLRSLRMTSGDWAFVAGWSVTFVLLRAIDAPLLAGRLITGMVS
jgi:cobalt/nickel transport system permease protein